ncbi:hypothetical protein NSMS1_35800 [Nostoc sp. MS1]|nr:hypothetical protein NSMS1_35800 [Nostoc sp. MS1]
MDIAQQKPVDYFLVPPEEQAQRIKINQDLCSIDDERFFIRSYLPLPVHGTNQNFGWGVWAEVEPESFFRYLELYKTDGSDEPPFIGLLSAVLDCYQPNTYQLPVDVKLRLAHERPLITFPEGLNHPLAQEQREGISLSRVHEIPHKVLPNLYEGSGGR